MKSLAPGVCQEGISSGGTFAWGDEQCPFLCNGRKKTKNKNQKTKWFGFATRLQAVVWFVRPGLEVCSPLQVQPCSCRAAEAGAGFALPSQFWGTGLHPSGACRCAAGQVVVWQCCYSSPEAQMDVLPPSASRFGLEEGCGVPHFAGSGVIPQQVLAEACRKQAGREGNLGVLVLRGQAAASASRSPS